MASSRTDLLHGLNDFLDDSMVLPPGELDKKTLMPVLNMAKERARKKKQKREEREKGRWHVLLGISFHESSSS